MKRCFVAIAAFSAAFACFGEESAAEKSNLSFDAGADLRIRQELMENVPGLPGGGMLLSERRTGFKNHMRFRPRVWGEVAGVASDGSRWRFYTRFTDEFRWNPEPYNNRNTFPGEVILDNLYLEGMGLFDKFLDFRIGRQDLNLCGLDHIFVDGTPADGSRTRYTDMVTATFHVTDISTIDIFGLYNADDVQDLRWGTDRSKHTMLTGYGSPCDPVMDDWGFGAIWGSQISPSLPYQLFVMQKTTEPYTSNGNVEHPWRQRELLGFKTVPKLDEEWSLQLEGMSQVGCDGNGATLSGWSAYSGINWKRKTDSTVKPFAKLGYHFMSGDDDAATEEGGQSAWDPMWARGVNDSEMFLYGTHYGTGWWSNMHYVKFTTGIDLGRCHAVTGSCGPLFAAAQDGLGGGDGLFKGFLSQVRYDFPLWLADKKKGERFEVIGHVVAEFFNPGNYFETEKPAYFIRWQLEFKF